MENYYSRFPVIASDVMNPLLEYVNQTWFFYQILIIALVYGAAKLLHGPVESRLEVRARSISGHGA